MINPSELSLQIPVRCVQSNHKLVVGECYSVTGYRVELENGTMKVWVRVYPLEGVWFSDEHFESVSNNPRATRG